MKNQKTRNGVAVTPAQAEVYDALFDWGPFPDHILVPVVQHTGPLHQHSSGIRTRRAELKAKGLIQFDAETRTNSGRKATVWRAK